MRKVRVLVVLLGLGAAVGAARAQGNGVSVPASVAALQPLVGPSSVVAARTRVGQVVVLKGMRPADVAENQCYAMRTYEFETGASLTDAPKLKGETTCVAAGKTHTRDVGKAVVIR